MKTLREILREKREQEKPLKHGPRKNRSWGRRQRKLFREENDLLLPGEFLGWQLHPKNAACRKLYIKGKARLDGQKERKEITEQQYEIALDELRMHYAKQVPIFVGMNARVRKDARSQYRKQMRLEQEKEDALESGGDDTQRPPTYNFAGFNSAGSSVLDSEL